MRYIKLANTDLEVSRACLGTMTFGQQTDSSDAERMVKCSLDAGINFFDTANVYNAGQSEVLLGRALGPQRDQIVLASKARHAMTEPSEYSGLSRRALTRAVDDSLQRLGTDYLDILYLHQPDYDTPIEETLEVLDELQRAGKIRYPATSNFSAWQIAEIHAVCQRRGYAKPWLAQPMYNLLARGIEQEFVPFTRHYGVSNVCYNPLAGGLLTGKHRDASEPAPGTRFDLLKQYVDRFWHRECFEAVAELQTLARVSGHDLVQLAYGWLLSQPHVHCVIVGASSPEQLDQNLAAVETDNLDGSLMEACDDVWSRLRGRAPQYNR